MKLSAIILLILITLSGCQPKLIGKLNMVSNRNVNPKLDYQLLSTYAGGSKAQLRRSRAKFVEDAADQLVKKVPGGEFLMNVKIYKVKGKYFGVEGDVWGIGDTGFNGFKVGDKVTFRDLMGIIYSGQITALKDDKTCYVKVDNKDRIVEVKYSILAKSN